MTPHEKQAEQRQRILGCYHNAADCIIAPAAEAQEAAPVQVEVIDPTVETTVVGTGAEIATTEIAASSK
jgi:hypothetical protein